LLKLGGAEGDELVERRMTAFRAGTTRWQRTHQARLLIAQYTSALGAFHASPDALKVLLYPIAHHSWMESNLAVEANNNPNWSEFLQGADLSDDRRRLLDAEIMSANFVVVPSTFARQTFIEAGVDPAKVHVLPLGGDLDRALAPGDVQAEHSDDNATLKVIFAGQLNQRKGLSYLLEAVSGLEKEVELCMIGPASGSMRKKLREEYPSVQVSHPLPRPQLLEAMRAADVLVLPSLAEGFGLVALEAMSVGTPAIVSDRTFGADVISHGYDGWVIEAASAAPLRSLLLRLSKDRAHLASVAEKSQRTSQARSWVAYTASVRQFLAERLEMKS
jgi:glycosyltransferase involved in cell wall biosynthesis